MTQGFSFEVLHRDGEARVGRITTPRGEVPTPAFMPVGTRASVKALHPDEVRDSGASILLGNTYHLMLRPGEEIVRRAGGLSRFMAWQGPTLTDSGGFQVFSLGALRKLSDEGVLFASHIDGKRELLTPERAVAIQAALGSDIAMILDVCPPGDADREAVLAAMDRTSLWARIQTVCSRPLGQAQFGIVQGGIHEDLRLAHLEEIASLGFDGLALGGLSVGEPIEDMYRILAAIGPKMPQNKPRYVMGIGTPLDLLEAIEHGIDMFDCVMPTRNARNGQAFVLGGKINIKQAKFAEDQRPLDPTCDCPCCRRFERRYLRHLFNVGEMLVLRLLTVHNLHHYGELTRMARQAIAQGTFGQLKEKWALPVEDV